MATLYAHIIGGELQSVGPLPVKAQRLDTLEWVGDVLKWAVACGYYDVETTEPEDVPATDEQRAVLAVEIKAALARRERRIAAGQQLRESAGIAKDVFHDWLDGYSSTPVPGSPNAGATWPTLTTAQKVEVMRDGMSYSSLWAIRTADALLLLADVLADIIDLADVDPPEPIGTP